MDNNQTLEKMRSLRLFGMHDAFKTSLETSIKEQMTQDQLTSLRLSSSFSLAIVSKLPWSRSCVGSSPI